MAVREALEKLLDEESDKRLDPDDVNRTALRDAWYVTARGVERADDGPEHVRNRYTPCRLRNDSASRAQSSSWPWPRGRAKKSVDPLPDMRTSGYRATTTSLNLCNSW